MLTFGIDPSQDPFRFDANITCHNDSSGTTPWTWKVLSHKDYGVFRENMCTAQGLKVNCVRQVDFRCKVRSPPCAW